MFLNCDAKVLLFFESANVLGFVFQKNAKFFAFSLKKGLLLLQLTLEVDHLDGCYGAFVTFIAQTTTGTVFCLLHIVGGNQTVDDRDVGCGIQVSDALGSTGTNIIEVRSVATNYASDSNDCIHLTALNHLC